MVPPLPDAGGRRAGNRPCLRGLRIRRGSWPPHRHTAGARPGCPGDVPARLCTTDALRILDRIADLPARCPVMTDVALGLADQADPAFSSIIDRAELLAATDPHREAPILADMASRRLQEPCRLPRVSQQSDLPSGSCRIGQ